MYGMPHQYGGLPPDGPDGSLHDGFLQDIQDTGLTDFAAQIGIIDANGEIPGVRAHEEWDSIAEAGPDLFPQNCQLPPEPQPSITSMQQGDRLLEAASIAAAKAAAVAEATKRRIQQTAEAAQQASGSPTTAAGTSNAVNTPPTKPARSKSSGRPSRGSTSGGDQPPAGRNNGKGLRHFSMKALANQVCEKVESKVRTTYNEVADELVSEFGNVEGTGSPGGTQYDEKNIRRRVYDALNVLIAMEIISRSKKEILWHGLPSGHGNALERARADKICLNAQIDKQQNYLQELLKTQTALRNLIQRNRDLPVEALAARNQEAQKGPTALQLPFILIQANSDSHVEIQISDDSRHAHFDFHSSPFKIHGDDEVLRHMGLHHDNPAPTLAPPAPLQLPPMMQNQAGRPLQSSSHMLPDQATPQDQMQMEADQRLAALQQQSYSQMQRQMANGPIGNPPPFHGHHTNGAVTANGSLAGNNSHDGSAMMSQNGSPMDDSPPNHMLVSGQRLPATPKAQGLSPGLHGMALSPGTLLPQMPLHGLHQPQASLINPSQGHPAAWQYAQANGGVMSHGHSHMQNGFPQELLAPDVVMSQHSQKQLQAGPGLPQTKSVARPVGPEPPTWNGRYEL